MQKRENKSSPFLCIAYIDNSTGKSVLYLVQSANTVYYSIHERNDREKTTVLGTQMPHVLEARKTLQGVLQSSIL